MLTGSGRNITFCSHYEHLIIYYYYTKYFTHTCSDVPSKEQMHLFDMDTLVAGENPELTEPVDN